MSDSDRPVFINCGDMIINLDNLESVEFDGDDRIILTMTSGNHIRFEARESDFNRIQQALNRKWYEVKQDLDFIVRGLNRV